MGLHEISIPENIKIGSNSSGVHHYILQKNLKQKEIEIYFAKRQLLNISITASSIAMYASG